MADPKNPEQTPATHLTSGPDAGKPANSAAQKAGLDDDRVVDFLRSNPEFLARNSDVLGDMTPPTHRRGDGIVDMQRFMVERLRGKMDDLKSSTDELIANSRSNMSIQTRTHAAVLLALKSMDLGQLVHTVTMDLPLMLDVDVISLCFEGPVGAPQALQMLDIRWLQYDQVDGALGGEHDIRLADDITDNGTLFGAGSGLVRSAGLMRLRPGRHVPVGLLALGARDPETFTPGQSSDLLAFLGRVIEGCVHRLADGRPHIPVA